MFNLNYLGSKKTLNSIILPIIEKYLRKNDKFGDLFSGTGNIAYNISKKNKDIEVIGNDLQYYSYVIMKALLTYYTKEDKKEIKEILNKLEEIKKKEDGFFRKNYSPPKRKYFTKRNAIKIDSYREEIEKYKSKEKIYYYLLANLISNTDKIANVPALYASYLKKFKKSALKELNLNDYEENEIKSKKNKIYNIDTNELVKKIKFDVVYIDPPYNNRQYGDNYHILETLAKNNKPKIHGKTGLPYEIEKSKYCKKQLIKEVFTDLIYNLEDCRVIIVSYNNEGLMSLEELEEILGKNRRLIKKEIEYKKFKNNEKIILNLEIKEYILISIKK